LDCYGQRGRDRIPAQRHFGDNSRANHQLFWFVYGNIDLYGYTDRCRLCRDTRNFPDPNHSGACNYRTTTATNRMSEWDNKPNQHFDKRGSFYPYLSMVFKYK
jgi:hypothetical protein